MPRVITTVFYKVNKHILIGNWYQIPLVTFPNL